MAPANEGMAETTDFLAGVIEGFYGKPWTHEERAEVFGWMADWGLNTYFYAPKDDLKHRALWREPYSDAEVEKLAQTIAACQKRNLRFIYGLSPGLDIRYDDPAELEHLHKRFEQLSALGCRDFGLLFDDIPNRPASSEAGHQPSLAAAQCQMANALFKWTLARSRNARFLVCPTPYCSRMAARDVGGKNYLPTMGRELLPEIDVFWTGPEIISREITPAHVQELHQVLRRKPVIWDNLHANDYDGRRFYCGPYAGRPPELREAVGGILSNPNNEFPLNFVPLRTLAQFIRSDGNWDARQAYLSAMREWFPRFATLGPPVSFEDFILFGDCHYLPHEEGPEAEALFQLARGSVASIGDTARATPTPRSADLRPGTNLETETSRVGDRRSGPEFARRAARLHELCARMAELRDRPLFYALSRRAWELREELDLLMNYVASKSSTCAAPAPFVSDSHLPGTYRGGMVARLQRLLVQQPDGSFTS